MKKLTIISLLSLCIIFISCTQSNNVKNTGFDYPTVSSETFSPDSIKIELDDLIQQIQDVHPCMNMLIDLEELFLVKNEIKEQITEPMNQLEVFRLFSRLNPVFADGHHGIALPDIEKQINDATKLGDRLFPIPVHIDNDFRLYAKTSFNEIAAGSEIHSINGINAVEITKYIERHTIAENSMRKNLMADRFSQYLWMQYGSSKDFVLEISTGEDIKKITIEGTTYRYPEKRIEWDFDDKISYEFLADNQVGYLKINTFSMPNELEKWFEFSKSFFKEIRNNDSKYLIIDLRQNTGGYDDMWIEGIMPYIATKKWQRMDNFLGRIIPFNELPEKMDEIYIFEYDGEYEVSDKPKFEGEVFVITGRMTYSSSIMFACAIKDNQLGKIVGQETKTYARGCQMGMPQDHEMKITNILAYTPHHWYNRNSDESAMEGISVDIQLPDNPFNEREIVDSLVQKLINN